jgi:hypothetical protein
MPKHKSEDFNKKIFFYENRQNNCIFIFIKFAVYFIN